jgi:hypothetical protein
MNKKTIGIIVLGLLFFATACVQQDIDPMAQDDSSFKSNERTRRRGNTAPT